MNVFDDEGKSTRSTAPSGDRTQWRSHVQRAAMEQLQRFARHGHTTILLEGESGTGKTLAARRIHDLSQRRSGPFQQVSLAALDDALASSELFGHAQGAFTGAHVERAGAFASANRGTLFLDEIGKSSSAVQRKLLVAIESHVIQRVGSDRPFSADVRIIAASNVDLHTLVERESMLPDLATRLGLFRVRLPALRERREDIPQLIAQMISKHARAFGYVMPPAVDEDLERAMTQATWPGNLRELDAVIQRLLVDANGAPVLSLTLCTQDLYFLKAFAGTPRAISPSRAREVARLTVDRKAAANQLGVSLSTLYRRLRDQDHADHSRVFERPVEEADRDDGSRFDNEHEI